ncbi:MAG: ribonuclease III [Thermoplasmata archaeon]|nr:ribonuclease III [Thermoplasmata archaeon]
MPGDDSPRSSTAAYAASLGITFDDPGLLERALVHGSWLHEHPDAAPGHNERLEFLGDSVISLVVSEALHRRHPADDEGILSTRRAAIVSAKGLARLARRIDLGEAILLGEGEAQQRGGRAREALLASAFEALAGAVFLDRGWNEVRAWLLGLAAPELEADSPPGTLKSPKNRLQELTQRSGERPAYRIVQSSGPDHAREFVVEVAVAGEVIGTGTGGSLRAAETTAAEAGLDALGRRDPRDRPAAGGGPAPGLA